MVKTIRVSEKCHDRLRRLKATGGFGTYEDLLWFLIKNAPKRKFERNMLGDIF